MEKAEEKGPYKLLSSPHKGKSSLHWTDVKAKYAAPRDDKTSIKSNFATIALSRLPTAHILGLHWTFCHKPWFIQFSLSASLMLQHVHPLTSYGMVSLWILQNLWSLIFLKSTCCFYHRIFPPEMRWCLIISSWKTN